MLSILLKFWYIGAIIIFLEILNIFRPVIKGKMGEKAVSLILSRLNPEKYKVINDVMLKIGDKTSQIDHVVVSNYGIFVIETKNYKGWIIGNADDTYWRQQIYRHKEKLYNPVLQNYSHVQALKHHLNEYPEITYVPIVAFSTNADLKVKGCTNVIYTTKLLKTVRSYESEVLRDNQVHEIYSKISSININDRDERKKHVENVVLEKKAKIENINNDICPRCGGKLVVRNGKYGSFKGCSNYPKCRFTVK